MPDKYGIETEKEVTIRFLRYVGYALAAFVVIVLFFGSYSVIQPGYSGVLFNRMTGSLAVSGQGFVFKAPFVTSVQEYPVALRTYSMVAKASEGSSESDDSLDLPTLEGQHIRQDLSVTYNTTPERAADVFRSFKGADITEIENTFVRRTIITVAQNASGAMSLSELISSKRGILQQKIQESLSVELSKMGFTLDKVNMGASHLPKVIEGQMQQKMAAQQEAQQAEYELQKQQTLAKAEVAKARGAADSELIHAEAKAKANALLRQSLTPELIRLRAIEKWDGSVPQIISDATPFVDLRGMLGKDTK